MLWCAYLECQNQNCKEPILLRYSKHLPLLDNLEWWPMGDQPVNFLCPSCKHVFGYSLSNIRRAAFEEQATHDLEKYQAVFSISKQCADSSSESLVKIHAPMSAVANDALLLKHGEEAIKLMAAAVPVNILCESRSHLVIQQSLRECLEWSVLVVSKMQTI